MAKPFQKPLLLWLFLLLHAVVVATGSDSTTTEKVTSMTPSEGEGDPSLMLFRVCSIAEDDDLVDIMPPVEAGADIEWRDPETGMTCLMSAIAEGKYMVVKAMLEQGAQSTVHVESEDKERSKTWSALHLAALHGRPHILKSLLVPHLLKQFGSSATSEASLLTAALYDENGMLPIHLACQGRQNRHVDTVTYMVKALGVDVHQPTRDGKMTCFDLAKSRNMKQALSDLSDLNNKTESETCEQET